MYSDDGDSELRVQDSATYMLFQIGYFLEKDEGGGYGLFGDTASICVR